MMLFNLYINNLRLTNSGIGGSLGGKFVNHMIYMYADDLCIGFFILIWFANIVENVY